MKTAESSVRVLVLLAGLVMLPWNPGHTSAAEGESARGREVLQRLIQVNQSWLQGPPENVGAFSYRFHLLGADPVQFALDETNGTHSRRQGITYYSILHAVSSAPEIVAVRALEEGQQAIRVKLAFVPSVKVALGNGVENRWRGYFSRGVAEAEVVIEPERMVPLKLVFQGVEETFSDFVEVQEGSYVPLSIRVEEDSSAFDWKFRWYQPGLWLFDYGIVGKQQVAWIDDVRINHAPGETKAAAKSSLARQKTEAAGAAALEQVLAANRNWLMPSLQARQGLVYGYRQEEPYRELVMFDQFGEIMVQLAASKQTPDQPTRERMWTADGKVIQAKYEEPFVRISDAPELWMKDRAVQNLAVGLGWDCALTRVAREPESFRAEVLPVENTPDRYLLVLHPAKDARLFTGTMLIFTSWAYMHDVRFSRSEIVCETGTHRVLEERDYASDGKLKGQYWFENYLEDEHGPAPGKIRALVPYEKDGQDHSLEVTARFRFAAPGVWLLDEVQSGFRGGSSSVGRVEVLESDPAAFSPMRQLQARVRETHEVLRLMRKAPKTLELQPGSGEWSKLGLQAEWSDEAANAIAQSEEKPSHHPVIGIYRTRVSRSGAEQMLVELEGISTAEWKEFETHWTLSGRSANGERVELSRTVDVRCEGRPSPFRLKFLLPAELAAGPLEISGKVEQLTGRYHGHGMWMRFARRTSDERD